MIFKLASVFKLRSDILAYSCKNKPYSSLIEAHLKLYDEDNLYSYVYLWFFLVHCIWILCQNYMYHELGSLHLARDSENTSCLSHFISTCSSGYNYGIEKFRLFTTWFSLQITDITIIWIYGTYICTCTA